MSLAQLSLPDLAGTILGFFLTLMVFSYVFGDNGLFRAAIYIFVGVASGYAAVVAWCRTPAFELPFRLHDDTHPRVLARHAPAADHACGARRDSITQLPGTRNSNHEAELCLARGRGDRVWRGRRRLPDQHREREWKRRQRRN